MRQAYENEMTENKSNGFWMNSGSNIIESSMTFHI